MTLDHRQHHLNNLRTALGVIITPIQLLTEVPRAVSDWFAESLATRRQLEEENTNLKAQYLVLETQLQKLEVLQAENSRLRTLLKSASSFEERVLIAEIMSVDLAPFSQQIVINKGSKDDVYVGQPLLAANGIMGQVVSVNPLSSIAMLISDPSHAIPVTINRNGLRAIAVGTGTANLLDVPHIPNNGDIQIGDLLVTSELGGRFPPNFPVAKVLQVEKNPSRPFAKVTAQTTANLDRAREVLLIWRSEGKAAAVDLTCEADPASCAPAKAPTPSPGKTSTTAPTKK